MDEDSLSRDNSCNSLSSYDADDLVPPEIPTPEKFNEKNVIDLIKCICCNRK